MKCKFGDSNIFTCYIKELLHDFNLPKAQVYTKELEDNDSLYEGKMYIKDNLITRYINGEFKRLDNFVVNYPVLNFTKNFIIKSSIYDHYTHYYLGNYLRFIRDYYDIDLMGMYNCFAAQEPGRILLMNSDGKKGVEIGDAKFEIDTDKVEELYYIVPVKFDKTYTIAMNVSDSYELACILYGDAFISDTPEELITESYKHIGGSTFYNPFTYSTKFNCTKEKELWKREKSLYLLIKLPKSVDTSIVILEGDFTQSANVVGGCLYPEIISSKNENIKYTNLSNKYLSKLSLLEVDDKVLYPFSERLIEYLLKNVISNADFIPNNIEYVQDIVYPIGLKGRYGIWDDDLRSNIYNRTLRQDLLKGTNKKYSTSFVEYKNGNSIIIPENTMIKYILYAPSLSQDITSVDKETGEVVHNIKIFNIEDNSIFELVGDDVLRLTYTIPGDSEQEEITIDLGLFGDGTVINNSLGRSLENNLNPDWDTPKSFEVDPKCSLQISSTETEKRENRFIDNYNDITGFVDKDVESLLKLQLKAGVRR